MAENARISVGILSSQTKIFPDVPPGDYPSLQKTHCTLLDGEAVSFQLAMRTVCGSYQPVSVAVQSSLDVSVYKIGYVPLTSACNPNGEEGYERSVGGLFPDVLLARPAVPEIVRYPNAWGGALYCEADTQATITERGRCAPYRGRISRLRDRNRSQRRYGAVFGGAVIYRDRCAAAAHECVLYQLVPL